MSTEALTLTVSGPLLQELGAGRQEFVLELLERGLREFKIQRALDRYARGGISFGAAAKQASLSLSEFARQAYARGMEPPYSAETLAEELG
ncbi:MAG: UPF0175 family protein [Chloroflexi bacterium]|nr:UPF0175 family protein [Chloroflexota bacterium]